MSLCREGMACGTKLAALGCKVICEGGFCIRGVNIGAHARSVQCLCCSCARYVSVWAESCVCRVLSPFRLKSCEGCVVSFRVLKIL